MRKKHQPGCPCCASGTGCGSICFHVVECDNTAIVDVSIAVTLAGVPIAGSPVVTDASGNACISIPSAATYAYSATKAGYATLTGTVVAACTTNNVTLAYGPNACVTVNGCNSYPLPGATVTIALGAFSSTGTTNGSGVYCVRVPVGGVHTVNVSKTRFTTSATSVNFGCVTSSTTISLLPAAGYYCDQSCVDPLPPILHLTTPAGTAVTLTYGSTPCGSVGATGWVGSEIRTVPMGDGVGTGFANDCGTAFVNGSVTFNWEYKDTRLVYCYLVCNNNGQSLVGATYKGQACVNGYDGVAESAVSIAAGFTNKAFRSGGVPTHSCVPFSAGWTFPTETQCGTFADYVIQYYIGTAMLTE